MRRFYSQAEIADAPGGGFAVTLDGKPVRTPGKRELIVPMRPLAEAIAAEWQAQPETIEPAGMGLTRLAHSALDQVIPNRLDVVDELARFAETDLVCYRAERPDELVARQQAAWQPLVDWAEARFGAALTVTAGLVPAAQPEDALARLRDAVSALADFPLAGVHATTTVCGSVIVGLALVHGEVDGEAAGEVSLLDETFQVERWGEDSEAADRRAGIRSDIATAAIFLSLCARAS